MNASTAIAIYIALLGTLLSGGLARAGEEPPRIAVGVYFNEGTHYAPDDEQSFIDLRQQTGRLAEVYENFQSWTEQWNGFAARLAGNAQKHGGIFMTVWMPGGGEAHATDPDWTCSAVAQGKHDEYVRRYAADVARYGKPVMIRFAHEMNGRWYPYGTAFDSPGRRHNGNTPADYRAMWRHVWQLFHDAGASNAVWVWSPNILYINDANSLDQQKRDYADLYPGDAFVDWIGLDGYNDGIKSHWKTFPDLIGESYKTIAAISSKPMMIAEFGCTEQGAPAGSSKAQWIMQTYLHDIPRQFPRIRLVNWFDRDKSKQGEADWRFNSSPSSLAAYREAVNSPIYQGKLAADGRSTE